MEPVHPTSAHIFSPYLLLSFNTSKEPSLSYSDKFSDIPIELDSITPLIGPNMLPLVMPSMDYKNTARNASSLQPRSSQSLKNQKGLA